MLTIGRRALIGVVLICLALPLVGCDTRGGFSGRRAMAHVQALCDLGPRPSGTEANREAAKYIQGELERSGWEVERQEWAYKGTPLCNVIGKRGEGPLVILGTHYDTRPVADQDAENRALPVLGANDGASGVAVLLELARVLPTEVTDSLEVWLAFFDAEDRGELDGWAWSVGSNQMATTLERHPEYVVIVDMVGDADQQIYYEWTSSLWLQERIWGIAEQRGYGRFFIKELKYSIVDDHSPFLQWGMTAALIIDFDYPYWHTTHDTPDKISADSLQRVGDVLLVLLEEEPLQR